MLEILLISCLLVWFPVLLHQIKRRGFLILLIWLFIAPVATNLVEHPGRNPFFTSPDVREVSAKRRITGKGGYLKGDSTITLRDAIEPTRILLGAFIIVFLLEAVLKKRKPLVSLNKTEIYMGVFSLILLVNVLFQARRLAFGLHVAVDAFVVPFLAYAVGRRMVTSEDRFRKLVQVMALLGSYLIAIGLMERVAHISASVTYRLKGPFEVRDAFYIIMMVVFFVVLIESLCTSVEGQRRLVPSGIQIWVLGFAPVIILLIWTRAVWVGFLLGIWTFAFLARKRVPRRRKLYIIGLVLSLIPIAFLGLWELSQVESVYDRVANPEFVYGRLATYQIIAEQVAMNPVFGIGLNNLRDVLAENQTTLSGIRSYNVSHSSYLALLAELGTIGLLGYLLVIGSILGMALRVFRMGGKPQDWWRAVGVIAILVAYLIPPLSDSILYRTWVSHVYVFLYAGAFTSLYDLRWLRPPVYRQRDSETALSPSVFTVGAWKDLQMPTPRSCNRWCSSGTLLGACRSSFPTRG